MKPSRTSGRRFLHESRSPILPAAMLAGCLALAAPAPACELEAQFVRPASQQLPGGESVRWRLQFRNSGKSECRVGNVRLRRSMGNSMAGRSVPVGGPQGRQRLEVLPPGARQNIAIVDRDIPQAGTFTYAIAYPRQFRDSNPRDHEITRTVTFQRAAAASTQAADKQGSEEKAPRRQAEARAKREARRLAAREAERRAAENAERLKQEALSADSEGQAAAAAGAGAGRQAASGEPRECDLAATFLAPVSDTLTGGEPVDWKLEFRNEGQAGCTSNSVSLVRAAGKTASGSGMTLGGSGGRRSIPALGAGQSATVTIAEKAPPETGTHTYAIRYASPMNDADNSNHRISKTVAFTAPAAAAPAAKFCDLAVRLMRPAGDTLPGGQAQTWELFFLNSGTASCPENRVYIARSRTGTRNPSPAEIGGTARRTLLKALAPRQSQSIKFIEDDTPPTGTYRYQLGFAKAHSDADNRNHSLVKQVEYESSSGGFRALIAPGNGEIIVEIGSHNGVGTDGVNVCAFSDNAHSQQIGATQQTVGGETAFEVPANQTTYFIAHKNGSGRTDSRSAAEGDSTTLRLDLFGGFQPTCPEDSPPNTAGPPVYSMPPQGAVLDFNPQPYAATVGQPLDFSVTWLDRPANATSLQAGVIYRTGSPGGADMGAPLPAADQPQPVQITESGFTARVQDTTPANLRLLVWKLEACNTAGCADPIYQGVPVNLSAGQLPTPPAAPGNVATWEALRPAFQHSSCVNCHKAAAADGGFGQLSTRHTGDQAPAGNPGACTLCHGNNLLPPGSHPVPWQAPPTTMDFRNKTSAQLCDKALDPGTLASDVEDHLTGDPLILWAVSGGELPPNPIGAEPEFAQPAFPGGISAWTQAVQAWVEAGTPCP